MYFAKTVELVFLILLIKLLGYNLYTRNVGREKIIAGGFMETLQENHIYTTVIVMLQIFR